MKYCLLIGLLAFTILQSCQVNQSRLNVDFIRSVCKNDSSISLYSSGASYIDGIRKMHLGFVVRRQMTIDEARYFYVNHAENYIEKINNDLNLRPFLPCYPITIDNIDLTFMFI